MRAIYTFMFVVIGIGVVFLAGLAAIAIEKGPYQ